MADVIILNETLEGPSPPKHALYISYMMTPKITISNGVWTEVDNLLNQKHSS